MNTTTEVLRDAIVSYRAVIVDHIPEENQVYFYVTQRGPLSKKDPNLWEFVGGQEDDMDCSPYDTISREAGEEAGFEQLDLFSLHYDPYTYTRDIDGHNDPKFGSKHIVTFLMGTVIGNKNPTIGDQHTDGRWATFPQALELPLTTESREALHELGTTAIRLLTLKPTRPQIEVLDITDHAAVSIDLSEDY